jgi:multimeric flavodoxin WrbA
MRILITRGKVMKIISIISSCRKNGNTENLVSILEEELKSVSELKHEEIEIERIYLGQANLKMCMGCRICFDKGEQFCPLKDDFLTIREKVVEADGVILASPVYVEDVNGIMKNWIDRMAFYCHRPALAGKVAVTITTSGAGSTNHALKTISFAIMSWGAYLGGQYKFRTGALMKREEIYEHNHSKVNEVARKLIDDIKNQKAYMPTLYSLIIFKVQQKLWQKNTDSQNSIDYTYWNNKGWLEPKCVFYTTIRTNWFKVKIARLFGAIIALFFK